MITDNMGLFFQKQATRTIDFLIYIAP